MNTYTLNPDFKPQLRYRIIHPDGTDDGIVYNNSRDAKTALEEIPEVMDSAREWRREFPELKDDELYQEWLTANIVKIAKEVGYRLLTTIVNRGQTNENNR